MKEKAEFVEPKIKYITEKQEKELLNINFKHNNQVNPMKINLNDVAVEVARIEGQKEEVNITQIKETMKCFGIVLGRHDNDRIIEVINRYRKKYNSETGEPRRSLIGKVMNAVGL